MRSIVEMSIIGKSFWRSREQWSHIAYHNWQAHGVYPSITQSKI